AAAFIAWAGEEFGRDELGAVLAATSICFDLSVFELFVPLAVGGSVVLAENILELPALAAAGTGITLLNTVPSAMAELLRGSGLPETVQTVNLAGEALGRALVEEIHAAGSAARGGRLGRVLNLYGPSEDTTYSTWTAVAPMQVQAPSIGRPVAGTRAYV